MNNIEGGIPGAFTPPDEDDNEVRLYMWIKLGDWPSPSEGPHSDNDGWSKVIDGAK